MKKNTETDPENRQHLRFDYLKVRLANQIHNALAQGELAAWGEMNLSHGTGPLAPIPADKWHEIVIDFSNSPDQFRNMAIKRSGGHMAYVDIKLSSIEFAKLFHVIPTAPNIDSLRDSQIRESLTRCWLLKEEQHRWVQRLRSDGLI